MRATVMNKSFSVKNVLYLLIGVLIGVFLITRFSQNAKKPSYPLALSSAAVGNSPAGEGDALKDYVDEIRRTAITAAVEKISSAVVGINVIQIREYVRRSPFFDDPFFRYFFPELRFREKVKGLGSGFIISPDGYLLTNEHVVHQATRIIVTHTNGKKYEAKIVGADYVSDIALLKIRGENFPYAKLGNSDDLIIGEWVIALGNPFGLFDINAKPTVTVGVISAVDRDFGRMEDGRIYQDMIQTDAAINGGNSGGPLVNCLGQVIGINTLIFSGNQTAKTSIGLGFAIPINHVKRILEDLKRYGEVRLKAHLGLRLRDLSPMIANLLGLDTSEGVIITSLQKGSPAERAGLKEKDVILEINGIRIRDTRDVQQVLEYARVEGSHELAMTVFRNGDYFETNLSLGEPSE